MQRKAEQVRLEHNVDDSIRMFELPNRAIFWSKVNTPIT